MRKQYVNNLRWFVVLLLVPYHAACVYRTPYLDFFVNSPRGGMVFFDRVVFTMVPWIMPMLFAMAGVSAYYALDKRSAGQFIKERVWRLLIPLTLCTIFLSPIQMYFGNVTHKFVRFGADGFWQSVKTFFTSQTFGGYAGGFSYTGFWFVRHLFYISLLTLPLLMWYKKRGDSFRASVSKMNVPLVIFLCGALLTESYLVKPSDYSMIEYGCFFLLGFFILSNDEIVARLKKAWLPLFLIGVACTAWVLYCYTVRLLGDRVFFYMSYRFLRWEVVLSVFALFARFFDRSSRVTEYFTRTSYGFYLLHQTILIATAYFINQKLGYRIPFIPIPVLYLVVVGIVYALTFGLNEIVRRIPGLRRMFGYKGAEKAPAAAAAEQ